MSQVTEREIRALLEFALAEKDPEAAVVAIRGAMINGIAIEKMTDLHFGAMLLLAAPVPEKRGRKKDPDAEMKAWYLNMACKLKARITGQSFAFTWSQYCDQSRPKKTTNELWRCAGILNHVIDESRQAQYAARVFELSKSDLQTFYVVNK